MIIRLVNQKGGVELENVERGKPLGFTIDY